jgi:UDP-N-acetylglucosamine 1-carboxyvinyltransferase
MDVLRIIGGTPLRGSVAVGGSKNAVLPIMAAVLLADGPVTLSAVPELTDVASLALLLDRLGVDCERSRVRIQSVDMQPVRAPYDLVRRMRASFCVLGPLLARRGRAVVALPGGCRIGARGVDLHLRGLTGLGADIRLERGYVVAQARRLQGARISMTGPRGSTVTGTANLLAAATLAKGETVLLGAALEPEIADLGNFLNTLGARIEGLGSPTLRILGVEQLGGAEYRVIPDRIEAATLLIAAAITGGSARVTGVVPAHLDSVLHVLQTAGAEIDFGPDWISLSSPSMSRLRPIRLIAEPYPGLPTDVQAQFTASAAVASGTSHIADGVFPERFAHVQQLRRLGAQIRQADGRVAIRGVPKLRGADVVASDLRASAALVLAALAAQGPTIVHQLEHLDRGYEGLEQKLSQLGADIERLPSSNPRDLPIRRKAARLKALSPFVVPTTAPVALATIG